MDDALTTAARNRVAHVLHARFGGVQVRMAAAADVTPSLINKILKGVQPPTEDFLRRLGRLPGVSEQWALSGEGEMEAAPAAPANACPVTSVLIPGAPKAHPEHFSGETFPAVADQAAGCYYHRVEAGSELLMDPAWGYRRGDLVLLQTDPARVWQGLTAQQRLCVIDWAADPAAATTAAAVFPVPARLVHVAGVGWVFERRGLYARGLYDLTLERAFLGPFSLGREVDACKVTPARDEMVKAAKKHPAGAGFAEDFRMVTPHNVLAMELLMVRRKTVDG